MKSLCAITYKPVKAGYDDAISSNALEKLDTLMSHFPLHDQSHLSHKQGNDVSGDKRVKRLNSFSLSCSRSLTLILWEYPA